MITLKRIKEFFMMLKDQNEELIWANVWHDTQKGISWLENMPGISPGRWAVGYNYLYVMTRILNELRPASVLELGLGASTTLISKYFENISNTDAIHFIAEHDDEWIKFYTGSHPLSACSKIKKQKLVKKQKDGHAYYAYENLQETIRGFQFQVISVDAPFGGGMHQEWIL